MPCTPYCCICLSIASAVSDFLGEGNETISHLRENGRITVMFIAFDGPPRIVRLFGTGECVVVLRPCIAFSFLNEHVSQPLYLLFPMFWSTYLTLLFPRQGV